MELVKLLILLNVKLTQMKEFVLCVTLDTIYKTILV